MTVLIVAFAVTCIALAGTFAWTVARLTEAYRTECQKLVDHIVLLKVDPPQAALRIAPEPEGDTYISSTDDVALAEYEKAQRA